jgi:iron complex outermembrane receptor protein
MNIVIRIIVISFIIILPSILFTQETVQSEGDLSLESLLNVKISTAAKFDQTMSEVPASVTIITSEEIDQFGYRTLSEVLSNINGFYTSNDRNYEYIGARGFSRPTDYNDRILLLLDGHTLNENFYGSSGIGFDLGINMDNIDRIEIVRGPGSVVYGTGAMFAVINIITKKGITTDGVKLSIEGGNPGRIQGSVVYGKNFGDDLDIVFSGIAGDIKGDNLYYDEYNNPPDNDGISRNLDWEKYIGIQSTIDYHSFTFSGHLVSRKKGVPTGAYGIIFNDDRAQTLDERGFLELKYDGKIGTDKNIMVRGYFDHYYYNGKYPNDILNGDANYGKWVGSEIQFRWDIETSNRLTMGVEYKNSIQAKYHLWDIDTTYFENNFPYHNFSFYIQDEIQALENVFVTIGMRRDAYSTGGKATTPRLGVIYNPIKTGTLKLLYGEAFRFPNVYETSYEDYFSGHIANPNLKPEKITTAEIIWEQRLADILLGTLSLFNYNMRDLIDSDTVRFNNTGHIRTNGLEISLNARLSTGINCYGNYTFQDAKYLGIGNQQLTNSPNHLLNFGFRVPILKNISTTTQLHYESERQTVYDTKTKPFLTTNVNLSFHPLWDRFELSILARNIFNVKYKIPGGYEHTQPAIQQDGRTLTAKINFKI